VKDRHAASDRTRMSLEGVCNQEPDLRPSRYRSLRWQGWVDREVEVRPLVPGKSSVEATHPRIVRRIVFARCQGDLEDVSIDLKGRSQVRCVKDNENESIVGVHQCSRCRLTDKGSTAAADR